jgi:hypothetical protein
VTAQPAFSFWKENHMKPAGAFVAAIEQGLSPVEALHSLPEYEPRYIDRVPIEVYRAAQRNGRRFFPVSSCRHRVVTHADILQATANLQQLRTWARESPNWALATGPDSGVFVLDVDGGEGLASLLDLCNDDWSWLDTLRSAAGGKRCISFAWPEGRRQISRSRQIAKGLRFLGEGDWVLIPPSREPHGAQHAYMNPMAEIVAAPIWLLDRAFEPADRVDPSRPFPPCSSERNAWSNLVLAEGTNDQS